MVRIVNGEIVADDDPRVTGRGNTAPTRESARVPRPRRGVLPHQWRAAPPAAQGNAPPAGGAAQAPRAAPRFQAQAPPRAAPVQQAGAARPAFHVFGYPISREMAFGAVLLLFIGGVRALLAVGLVWFLFANRGTGGNNPLNTLVLFARSFLPTSDAGQQHAQQQQQERRPQ